MGMAQAAQGNQTPFPSLAEGSERVASGRARPAVLTQHRGGLRGWAMTLVEGFEVDPIACSGLRWGYLHLRAEKYVIGDVPHRLLDGAG